MIEPHKDRKYRPTAIQWSKIADNTEIDPVVPYSTIELINFDTSYIHLKGGMRIAFDCLSESQYVHVCNGGYYEEAPEINEKDRI